MDPSCETKPICPHEHRGRQSAGLRQNKANFRTDRKGQEPPRLPVPSVGAIVRNKANLPALTTKRRSRAGPQQKKANFRAQVEPMDLESATVRWPHPRRRTAQDLHGRARRHPIQWSRSLGVVRDRLARYAALGRAGPEKKPSEPDQDRRSINRRDMLGRYACVGKRWTSWCRSDESLPRRSDFFIGREE